MADRIVEVWREGHEKAENARVDERQRADARLRRCVEKVREDCPYTRHADPLYRSVHMAALDALLMAWGEDEK